MNARLPKVWKICPQCTLTFRVHPYRAATARYCSKACWADRAPYQACKGCQTRFKVIASGTRLYCSKACANNRRGALAPAWKDGKSLDRERARLLPESRKWRAEVFIRDGRTCQHCGARDQPLHAHHIKEWATHPELRFEVANGLTLCVDCHGRVHGKDFRKRHPARSCADCGKKIGNRGLSGLCRRCVIVKLHRDGRLAPPRRFGRSRKAQPSGQ